MRKSNSLHKLILLGAFSLLFTACADNSNSAETNAEPAEENTAVSENDESENTEEFIELEDNEDISDMEENNDNSIVFNAAPDSEETNTMDRAEQEANNGIDADEDLEEAESKISELVSMSEEERETHHQSIAAEEDELTDEVFDNLLLPGVHENTKSYGGRVGPKDRIRFEFPDADNPENHSTVTPVLGEDGYFRVDMTQYDFSEGEIITVRISGEEYPHEQVFELPVYSAEEGVEFTQVR